MISIVQVEQSCLRNIFWLGEAEKSLGVEGEVSFKGNR